MPPESRIIVHLLKTVGRATLCAWLALTVLRAARATDNARWLNARDLGASGSDSETSARTTAGANTIVVADVGDFKVGQGVVVSGCNPTYTSSSIRGPQYGACRPLKDLLEIRGYDGSSGDWTVFILEVNGTDPLTFRWTDDLSVTWGGKKVPITFDWQPLSGGTKIRFAKKHQWEPGLVIGFHARNDLVSTIDKIDGTKLTLRNAPSQSVTNTVVRHCDHVALQRAVSRAIQERRNLFIPAGHYRMMAGLYVNKATGITIEGAAGANTILDISSRGGTCVRLGGGTEVTLRNLRLVGHTGMGDGPGWHSFQTTTGWGLWPMWYKGCNAVSIRNTERVLIENVHASRMNCEAFYCHGAFRVGHSGWSSSVSRPPQEEEPESRTKSLTYLRCSATDCDGNAFNNNDLAENTSVLHCRIVDVGGCTWEGASRFVKFIGNYVRNSGPLAMGNIGSRAEHLETLPSGQHIIADNVFEQCQRYNSRAGGSMVRAVYGANEVIIRNNQFINFNSSGIYVSSMAGAGHLPAFVTTITGNVLDLTCVDGTSLRRTGIEVGVSQAVIADNQVYVRGPVDPLVTAVRLREPALNITMHDNVVRNCGAGLVTHRAGARIAEVIDSTTFASVGRHVPFECRRSHRYRGWNLVWLSAQTPTARSIIETFDPEACRFTLTAPRKMRRGAAFEVFTSGGANWRIHHNIFTGCLDSAILDSYGSPTTVLSDNTFERGQASNIVQVVESRGRFDVVNNYFCGFDEPGSCVLRLYPDRFGKAVPNAYLGNVFTRCLNPVGKDSRTAWEAAVTAGNRFVECGTNLPGASALPEAKAAPPPRGLAPVLRAPKTAAPVKVDGHVGEWPWDDNRRTVKGKGEELKAGLNWGGDGMELSFRSVGKKAPGPIYVLWATIDGTFNGSTAMGASPSDTERVEKASSYAARVKEREWTCEWRIPFAAMGLRSAPTDGFKLNVGLLRALGGSWTVWIPTGGRICEVDMAGEILLEK